MHALDEVDNRRHLRSVKLEDLELMSLRIYELSRDKVFAMEIDFFLVDSATFYLKCFADIAL